MPLDLKPMYDHLEKENKGGKFGYLPLMMGCSVGQLGALNAESFAERVNSAAEGVAFCCIRVCSLLHRRCILLLKTCDVLLSGCILLHWCCIP